MSYRVDDAVSQQNCKFSLVKSEDSYKKVLENKFQNITGTPSWAKVEKDKDIDSDDSEHEILKVLFNFYYSN